MTYGFYDQEALGEALLLHAALRAEAQGKDGFLLYPNRCKVTVLQVKYGDPGKEGMPTEAVFNAAKVVEDLSGKLPAPPKK